MRSVNIDEKLAAITDYWRPHIVGELNGQQVKLAKLLGTFDRHHHAEQDELFLVLRGCLRMRLADGEVRIGAGEFFIVPRGVEHQPVADEEVHVLLFEPAGTVNTGNLRTPRTILDPPRA
jgi:mannose-6-phosphate isomerase-like protein (cupin superfamily)